MSHQKESKEYVRHVAMKYASMLPEVHNKSNNSSTKSCHPNNMKKKTWCSFFQGNKEFLPTALNGTQPPCAGSNEISVVPPGNI